MIASAARMARLRATTAFAFAFAALALPATAAADYHQVIRDCAQDGKLDRKYPEGELKRAHENVPTDVSEYTDCKAVIAAAMENGGGGSSTGAGPTGGAGGTGGVTTDSGATAASHADASALKSETDRARRSRPAATAGGQTLRPVASGLNHVAGAANDLPTPLLVAIIAVAVLCLGGGIAAGWRRSAALIRAPLRVIRR